MPVFFKKRRRQKAIEAQKSAPRKKWKKEKYSFAAKALDKARLCLLQYARWAVLSVAFAKEDGVDDGRTLRAENSI